MKTIPQIVPGVAEKSRRPAGRTACLSNHITNTFLNATMSTNNLKPKKSLGQHFLHSPTALKKIIDAAEITPGETVLEIGPGTGILTEALLATGASVIAVEMDNRAYSLLTQKFAGEIASKGLKLIMGDVLKETLPLTDGNYSLVANIPYYITGAILEKFLEHSPRPNRIVLLVQKEVAERIVARDKKESVLSISVKAFGTPRIVAIVPRGAFVPAPTVDSAIIAIENISGKKFSDHSITNIKHFFQIVRAGFAHKRKFLKRNLESMASPEILDTIWETLGINEKVRAEDIVPEDWVKLAALISKISNGKNI